MNNNHPALKSLTDWYVLQHPEDQHSIDPIMDKLSEVIHNITFKGIQKNDRVRYNDERRHSIFNGKEGVVADLRIIDIGGRFMFICDVKFECRETVSPLSVLENITVINDE